MHQYSYTIAMHFFALGFFLPSKKTKMITAEKVRAAHIVEKDGKLFSYRETIVSELEEINNKYDIDYVVDKLKDGFYGGAILHGLELEAILNNKKNKNV